MCTIGEPDDYAKVWQWAKVSAAKKEHVCDSCGGPIKPGETYYRFRCLYDGYWTAEKQCAACEKDSTAFCDAHGGVDFSPSGFVDHLIDCVSEEDPEDAKWRGMLKALQARGAEVSP